VLASSPAPLPPPAPDSRGALDWATYFVPPELHGPLGLTAEALAAVPPAPRDDEERARGEATELLASAEACLPVFTSELRAGGVHRSPAEAWAGFTLGADGRPRDVVVRAEAGKLGTAERCAAEAIGGWTLGAPRLGGRIWLNLQGRGADQPHPPAAEEPDLMDASPPRLKVRDCIAGSIRLPRALQGLVVTTVVRFAIGRDGLPRQFRVLSPADLPVRAASAIFESIRQCDWAPGTTKGGEPIQFWVLLPIRLSG